MAATLDMSLRSPCTGEVSFATGELAGLTIHELARMLEVATPGQVLVSEATRLLARSGDRTFREKGRYELRGI